jgi:predicted small metal-binding protein
MGPFWHPRGARATRFLRCVFASVLWAIFHAFFTPSYTRSRPLHVAGLFSMKSASEGVQPHPGRRDAVKTLACKDTGMQCNWVGRAETEQELLNQATQHVKQVHNMDMTPEKAEMARKVISEE